MVFGPRESSNNHLSSNLLLAFLINLLYFNQNVFKNSVGVYFDVFDLVKCHQLSLFPRAQAPRYVGVTMGSMRKNSTYLVAFLILSLDYVQQSCKLIDLSNCNQVTYKLINLSNCNQVTFILYILKIPNRGTTCVLTASSTGVQPVC